VFCSHCFFKAGREVFVTTDQNLRYQQNLKNRTIAVVVLMSSSWPRINKETDKVAKVIGSCTRGSYAEVKVQDLAACRHATDRRGVAGSQPDKQNGRPEGRPS
jgi:hypothetical protein